MMATWTRMGLEHTGRIARIVINPTNPDLVYVCAPAPLQIGVAEGIRQLPESFYRNISREYVHKRDQLCGVLSEIGLPPSVPKGAYYVLSDASILPGKTSREKALYLLQQTGVASVAGSAFYHGAGGENLIRFCFAKTDAELSEACVRLKTLPSVLDPERSEGPLSVRKT